MTAEGMISMGSIDGYAATVDRLDSALEVHGIEPILRWDHAAAAASVDLMLRPLLLILFGDPSVGTALMQESPATGIDLPLKLLIWGTEEGRIGVGYNDPLWIRARHGLGTVPNEPVKMAVLLHDIALRAAGLKKS
jgi:uncharacterized protein (DUF302 family)